MIAKLKGKIEFILNNYVVLDVNDVGYKIFMTAYSLGKIAGSDNVEIFIHTHVREDVLALYGFMSLEELEMFELLISVSGIGPKAGLGILTIADPKTIKTAIANDDASILTRVSGVGKKTAERVILELQNKVSEMPSGEKGEISSDGDVLEALVSMGYSISEARDALKSIPREIIDVSEKIKMALKNIGKK